MVMQVGDGLSSASHVIGELTPATWYELCVEAFSDAGVERVTLRADTHTLAGGQFKHDGTGRFEKYV